ncbi:MAG: hypothetical protein AAGJ83_13615, partial [Planctomycetota bacterium]
ELFGMVGPSWYAEGLAELLSVHRGSGASVKIGGVPPSNEAVPYWGRFPLIRKARERQEIPTLRELFTYDGDLQGDVESYGWVWLLILMLSEHEDYRAALQQSMQDLTLTRSRFMERFRTRFAESWPIVQARWRLTASTIDYGYDWSRERCRIAITDPLWDGARLDVPVKSDRGWQSCGVRFAPGQVLRVTPSGRCTLQQTPKPWVSEPAGVTLRYVQGRPLGALLFCVLPNQTTEEQWLEPLEIKTLGSDTMITVKRHCWILLRINDGLSELADNRGGYQVRIVSGEDR